MAVVQMILAGHAVVVLEPVAGCMETPVVIAAAAC